MLASVQSLTCHRGCVTPEVVNNWRENSGMDMDLVDGYDGLPEWAQEKVKRALEQIHVDDDDWNGVSISGNCIRLLRLIKLRILNATGSILTRSDVGCL